MPNQVDQKQPTRSLAATLIGRSFVHPLFDYLLIGGELMRVAALPPDPDSETNMDNFMGQRRAFEGTTPIGHALDTTAPVWF